MGVDIQTYRARIGTFRHSVGVDVVTVVCYVNYSGSFKTIGSVVFVGLLLLIAGVEPNPGPKEGSTEGTDVDKEITKETDLGRIQSECLLRKGQDKETDSDVKQKLYDHTGAAENVESSYGDADSDYETDQRKELFKYLNILGLQNKYPGKITLQEVKTIYHINENSDLRTGAYIQTVPWLMLQRLVSTHSEARDMAELTLDKKINEEQSLFYDPSCDTDDSNISPLDIFYIVYMCCDHNLQQVLFQKLYLCKLAVPFVYIDFEEPNEQPTLSLWPLRFLTIDKVSLCRDTEIRCKETDVLEFPTKVVAFARFGRPQYSKSKLINSLFSIHGCNTFFNFDSRNGAIPRVIGNGFVEMFWLPSIEDKKEKNQDALTFLNLRGNVENQFSDTVISMLSHITDLLTIVIDKGSLNIYNEAIVKLVTQFSSVTIIFSNSLLEHDKALIDSFRDAVLFKKSDLNLSILSTHKRNMQRNVTDMMSNVKNEISNQLKSVNTKSLKERLENCKLRTDESSNSCKTAKEAAENLIKLMKSEGEPYKWKQDLTPIQCQLTNDLGNLTKLLAREKVIQECEKIKTQISEIRARQMKSVTQSVTYFVKRIITYRGNMIELEFFLGWLKYFIDKEKRKLLPPLMDVYRLSWQTLKDLKAKHANHQEIKYQENKITEIEMKIEEASFSIENFFREVGHIYDSFLESGFANETTLPDTSIVAQVVAYCVFNGHNFELIDGEHFYMPCKWINEVFKHVNGFIGTVKVMTVSVLGVQSSGKSTLLNTMFGSDFSVRSGRCTRGIHMQLIPIKYSVSKDDNSSLDNMYLAIIDTEGLRSPQFSHITHEHDNELATVITGLGDITLINIMGENTTEIRDILQVIVHAFLRLKRTNRNLDIAKCCSFVHQNVSDASASDNMFSGLVKLLQVLDEMTKESASIEEITDITAFNQVIEFDINSQVWYLKNFWQGNPPMARVNYEYSEQVMEIKNILIERAIVSREKSSKTIGDILIQGFDLWKGVLNEDFVFSFRNSLEIKAYIEMENYIQKQFWKFESCVHEKITELTAENFAAINHIDDLRTIEMKTKRELMEHMCHEKTKTLAEIETHFTASKFKVIIKQWENTQTIRLDNLSRKLESAIGYKIEKQREKRSVEILTVSHRLMHEEKLWKQSMDEANKNKDKNLSPEDKDRLFEEIWESFVQSLNEGTSSIRDQVYKSNKTLQDSFINGIFEIFNTEGALVKEHLISTNLETAPSFTKLQGSFNQTGITSHDVSCSIMSRAKHFTHIENYMNNVKAYTEAIFKCIDEMIFKMDHLEEEITDINVSLLLHNVQNALSNKNYDKTDIKFKKTAFVKIFFHVSNFACHIFTEHNLNYQRQKGVQALMDEYKEQQKISFESHLNNRQSEETFAKLFSNVVETFIREKTEELIQTKATDYLFYRIPNVKNKVIVSILTELAESGSFWDFIGYIDSPNEYAEWWITEKCQHYLFDKEQGGYYSLAKIIVGDLFLRVRKCIDKFKQMYPKKMPETEVDVLIDQFVELFKAEKLAIPKESFRLLKKTGKSDNVEYLSKAIIEQIIMSHEKLESEIDQSSQGTVKWKENHPIDRIVKEVWGCKKKCAFCWEPCAKTDEHSNSDHYSIQHRPLCCRGSYYTKNGECDLESCNFLVNTNKVHNCKAFDYLCNQSQQTECKTKWHEFKKYKNILQDWDLQPSSNMNETSKFWLWFINKYKCDLESFYGYKVNKIPVSWESITKEEAIKSLKEIYNA